MLTRSIVHAFIALLITSVKLHANNELYPPAPSAQSAIHWQDGYFYIDGKPTFITSGEMHYARIPRELWRDRIWRSKMMGFNSMQMYVFWNCTEGKDGHWDFSDNTDLDAWLTMIQEAGMYATVRVGPYSCAEWEQGGLPSWLTIKPGMTVRDSGADFEKYVDQHLAKVEAIVAKHQINKGGSVILVQLENEHTRGWGTDDKDPYLHHLVDQARANGLEIPLFLSGLHHGADPSGEKPYPVGTSPWFTTEFWTGWIGNYGDMSEGALDEKIRGTWKIIAFGGAGYDYYMVHGGTNFGYSGDSFETSYDYSAPIGETGHFHNFYWPAKRAAWFAQSFSSLLTGSHDDPDLATADNPNVRVTCRTNPNGGSLIMIDAFDKGKSKPKNAPEIAPAAGAYKAPEADTKGPFATQLIVKGQKLPTSGPLNVQVREPRTILLNIPWTKNASFASVCTNVLYRSTLGATDYWVCYGQPGETGEITLKVAGTDQPPVRFTYPSDTSVKEVDLDSGDGMKAKVLVMNIDRTSQTWFAHDKIYIGPSFVREDGSLEFPPEGGTATVYSASGASTVTQDAMGTPTLPVLANWTWRDASVEKVPGFNTSGWLQSTGPQPMETYDDFQNRYGWYRTTLHRDAAGPVTLRLADSSGTLTPFLNGQPAKLDHLEAAAGDNSLAILVKAGPRSKIWGFTGPIGERNACGIWGGVSFDNASTPVDVTWKQISSWNRPDNFADMAQPAFDDSTWKAVTVTDQKLGIPRGWTVLRGTFTLAQNDTDSILQLSSFGSMSYLNGQPLLSKSQDVSKLLTAGKNELCLLLQSRDGESTNLGVQLMHNSPLTTAKWYFHPGLDDMQETPIIGRVTNWKEFLAHGDWQTGAPATPELPTFWRTTFTYQHPEGMKETIGLLTKGLKSGHVWLNGHNLGECPQRVPMYAPECWLNNGDNDLVIFDLNGSKPDQVQLSRYEAFAVHSTR